MSCSAPCRELEILDSTALWELGEEWDALLEQSYDNRIFLTPVWHRLWWGHFGRGTAHILTQRSDDGVLTAVLPLHLTDVDGEEALTLVGDFNLADYMDGAARKERAEELLVCLWSAALDLDWPRIRLRHVPASSPLIPALHYVAAQRDLRVSVERDDICPVALLCSNWEGYLQMLSKKQRHEIRRKIRRAEEGASWEWRTVTGRDELQSALPAFFRLHEESAHEKATFFTPAMRDFFRDMADMLLEMGVMRLSLFTRDGLDLAATMSFLYRDRFLLYNSGYDPAHATLSPGIVAVAHAMQDAIEAQAVAFDFLSGDEPYKYQFGATNTYTCKISVDR